MNECRCGCGQTVSPRKSYRPGHDARHLSALLDGLRHDAEHNAEGLISRNSVRIAMSELSTVPLKVKLSNSVERFNNKQMAKLSGNEPSNSSSWLYHDSVRVGRWDYPSRYLMLEGSREMLEGSLQRNTKRDGSGEWVAV